MSLDRPTFPEYGSGGDTPGALRGRRAFQFCVAAAVLFTAALYLAEQYYRYDHAETLYRNGLTKHPESGRVELRAAVRTMEERDELPPSKYLQALAEREEADLVLPTYKRAYELDPANPELAIRYGARLFKEGDYLSARERFRDATVNAPDNALAYYLEAAALAMSASNAEDFNEAMAMVVRTNASNLEVNLPRVLWFPSLPRESRAYANLLRMTADECAAPLYRLAERVIDMAPEIAEQQGFEQADVVLQAMQNMGLRLIGSPDRVAPLAIAGLTVFVRSAEERERLAELEGIRPADEAITKRVEAEAGLERLLEFEAQREERLERHQARVEFPLWRSLQALGLIIAVYAFAALLSLSLSSSGTKSLFKFVLLSAVTFFSGFLALLPFSLMAGMARHYWSIPLKRSAVIILSGGVLLLLLMLIAFTMAMDAESADNAWMQPARYAWTTIVLGLCIVAVVLPGWTLPKAKDVAAAHAGDDGPDRDAARGQRARAWATLARRHMGILAGLSIVAVCVWFIAFRMVTSTFPLQFVLVTPGLRAEEAEVISTALNMLG